MSISTHEQTQKRSSLRRSVSTPVNAESRLTVIEIDKLPAPERGALFAPDAPIFERPMQIRH
jgi:hypothetical protein